MSRPSLAEMRDFNLRWLQAGLIRAAIGDGSRKPWTSRAQLLGGASATAIAVHQAWRVPR